MRRGPRVVVEEACNATQLKGMKQRMVAVVFTLLATGPQGESDSHSDYSVSSPQTGFSLFSFLKKNEYLRV